MASSQTVLDCNSKSWLLMTLLLCPIALQAAQLVPSNAMITSRTGSVSMAADTQGKGTTPGIREIILPTGSKWNTAEDATVFIAFSNGVGLGIDAASEVHCVEYSQRPFRENEEGFEYEPSVSKLHIKLNSGQIAISGNQLSPLSDVKVILPVGSIKVHKGSHLIRYDSLGLFVATSKGNLSYEYPDGRSREFVTSGKTVFITERTATNKQIAKTGSINELKSETVILMQATDHASRRVIFKANDDSGNPPQPVMIVRPEYFQQASLRPYQFLD